MPRYKFYQLKGKPLPDDINAPVKEMLFLKLDCKVAAEELDEFEKSIACGEIQIYDKRTPRLIRIKTNYGMVEGYDLIKTIETERHVITALKHIKNRNLDMRKEREEPNNGQQGNSGKN